MTTISGTPLGTPTGTTLQNLIDRTQELLDDAAAATWSETALGQWLNDAIRDYSLHHHRQTATTITTSAADHKYDLPANFIDPIAVEYPTGEDPPKYLQQRPFTHPHFWGQDGYFDIIHRHEDQDYSEIWISQSPAAAETITIEYNAHHDFALSVSGYITVPAQHHHILIAYALWQSSLNLQLAEQQSPTSNSSLLMAQHAANSDRLRRAYIEALARSLRAEEGRGGIVSWDQENIY